MPSIVTHFAAVFGAMTTLITFKFWQLIGPLILRYETIMSLFLLIVMYGYVNWLVKYHEPMSQAKRLIRKDMMRSLHIEIPQFIQMGFKDLEQVNNSWKLIHKNFSFYANKGHRPYMEDRMQYYKSKDLAIFSIFDGHGGSFVSEFLEENFSKKVQKRLETGVPARKLSMVENGNPFDTVKEAIMTEVHKIDDEITRCHQRKSSTTGSTLISAILEDNRFLSIVNVGDSRAIACDLNGNALAMSRDHKPSDASERRRIENAGGYIETYGVERVQGVLAVSRAFGDNSLKGAHVVTAHPDITQVDLTVKPLRYLIVASDGFFDVFENQEAIDFANQFLKAKGIGQWSKLSAVLVNEALNRGTEDNVSVLVVKLIL